MGRTVDGLTEKQARSRLGSGRAQPVVVHRPSLEEVLVVGTDGLWRHARFQAIVTACARGDAEDVAAALIERPRLPSGDYPDDIALAVVVRPPRAP